MNNLKSSLAILLVTVVAFVWGYKQDSIETSVAKLLEPEEDSPEVSAPAPAQKEISPPVVEGQPSALNPYAEMTKQAAERAKARAGNQQQVPFGGTLDSLQRGNIHESQKRKRNLYFERLSEQMKQLQSQSESRKTQAPKETKRRTVKEEMDSLKEFTRRRMTREPAQVAEEEEVIEELEDEEFIDELAINDADEATLEAALEELAGEEGF